MLQISRLQRDSNQIEKKHRNNASAVTAFTHQIVLRQWEEKRSILTVEPGHQWLKFSDENALRSLQIVLNKD